MNTEECQESHEVIIPLIFLSLCIKETIYVIEHAAKVRVDISQRQFPADGDERRWEWKALVERVKSDEAM